MSEQDNLVRLLTAALDVHQRQHKVYGSTATCSGGIGGAALTEHCSVTCGYFEKHEKENNDWHMVMSAFFHRKDGNPDWAKYIPEGY